MGIGGTFPDELTIVDEIQPGDNVLIERGGFIYRLDIDNLPSGGGGGGSVDVINNLTSTSTTDALSANQGRLLNEEKASTNYVDESIGTLNTNLSGQISNKLDINDYIQHFRGVHPTLGALDETILDAVPGDYAIVDDGSGSEAVQYIWDDSNSAWIAGATISVDEQAVRNTPLTGLSLATGTVISALDTVLTAFGKLQKQISDVVTSLSDYVTNSSLASTLAGYITNSALNTFSRYSFNPQSGTTYTLQASDVTVNGKVIVTCTNAAGITVTLPTPATLGVTTGDSVNFRQGGAGIITLSGTVSGNTTTAGQYETFTLIAESGSSWMRVGG